MRRLIGLAALGSALLLSGGCLDLLARAALDPQGLVKDIGTAAVQNTARSLITDGELAALTSVENTVSKLDQIVRGNPDQVFTNDLAALRDNVNQGMESFIDAEKAQQGPEATPGIIPGAVANPQGQRRLGAVGADPRAVNITSLTGRDLLAEEASRRTCFAPSYPSHEDQRLRSRDPWRFNSPRNSSLDEPLQRKIGVDISNGELIRFQRQQTNPNRR